MIKKIYIFLILITFSVFANETFELEKEVKKVNEELIHLKKILKMNLENANELYSKEANEEEYLNLLSDVKEIRKKIGDLEDNFRKEAVDSSMKTDEGYAFWDQAESSISQLIMEYGSGDYLYVIPQEIANLKINLFSTIPIPKNSWDDLLRIILTQNGIGIKKLNSYLRQLYILKHDQCNVDAIVTKVEDLDLLDVAATVCYIFSPKIEQINSVQNFLERFSDLKQTSVHTIKSNVIVIGSNQTLRRLVNLYDAVFKNSDGKIIKVVNLNKVEPQDAEKILTAFFTQSQKTRPSFYQGATDELSVVVQGNNLVLIGEVDLVDRAEKIILDLEKQLDDPGEMVIYWYTCKHSDPNEIAEVLEKVYGSITNAKMETKEKEKKLTNSTQRSPVSSLANPNQSMRVSSVKEKDLALANSNFVVDSKSGAILMVVKKEDLKKVKALLEKLDTPKKMVQIDVLLVERTIRDRRQTGINLLKIGSPDTKKDHTELNFNSANKKGVLDFIISRVKGPLPSFDIALSFLMAKEDMKIVDCPSILAINQTEALISIVDEISINNGAVRVDSKDGPKEEKSYSRAEYGTTIAITPTIHLSEDLEKEEKGFVTLRTNVSFQTTNSTENDRPNITKRNIENEVRVADGETIILGGLRRKIDENDSEKIPFLGEIPGIGKLFGTTKQKHTSSEMFIFITPHIIKDSKVDLAKQRENYMQKRQGDIDEFLEKLTLAKKNEKKKLFEKSLELFFDR
ncbi:MAG: Type II secretion system protein D [Candidatus Anoxychlamydiales bacterium]|nr:Type II secretion system protein D [Candidatus Anoxychlamydiales bacterium]